MDVRLFYVDDSGSPESRLGVFGWSNCLSLTGRRRCGCGWTGVGTCTPRSVSPPATSCTRPNSAAAGPALRHQLEPAQGQPRHHDGQRAHDHRRTARRRHRRGVSTDHAVQALLRHQDRPVRRADQPPRPAAGPKRRARHGAHGRRRHPTRYTARRTADSSSRLAESSRIPGFRVRTCPSGSRWPTSSPTPCSRRSTGPPARRVMWEWYPTLQGAGSITGATPQQI
jgi:hypothetical protein